MPLSKLLFSFEGRIPRSTFWYYTVALAVVSVLARVVDAAIAGQNPSSGYGCVTVFAGFAGIVTGLAVVVKRCHDVDRSPWFLLVGLIPIVGQIWLLAELGFRRGTAGANGYGADPLEGRQALRQNGPAHS
jgi:uncharacterized membrane protein YhaH (DUF805 family)